MKLIDKIPLIPLAIMSLFFALAPISPEPHLFEKAKMLISSTLTKPIDIFDFLMHGGPIVLLIIKLTRRGAK